MKILNLYACLGGNRYKWGDEHEITAVELDPELARMYKERFPSDNVVNGDAHEYLLEHFDEYDFIWSSPPCPTHSLIRYTQHNRKGFIAKYPDMTLYQEIIFLKHHFKGKYVVENVVPYYEPLIPAVRRGRHLYWANFNLPKDLNERAEGIGIIQAGDIQTLCRFHSIDLSGYKGKQRKDQIARNLVDFEVGKSILDAALGAKPPSRHNQIELL
jgi:DNA (cytosine-5)-methyltransferase 1